MHRVKNISSREYFIFTPINSHFLNISSMKKITVLLLIFACFACSKPNEKEMIYSYLEEKINDSLNINIKDTDFKINLIKKSGVIKSSDSINYYKEKLSELWSDSSSKNIKDTLSFDYVINTANELKQEYQKLILGNEQSGNLPKNPGFKAQLDQYIKMYTTAISLKKEHDKYVDQPNSILSTLYKVNYSITIPKSNSRKTVEKILYTNSNNDRIVQYTNSKL